MARIQGNEGQIQGTLSSGTDYDAFITRWGAGHRKRKFEVTPMPRTNAPLYVTSTLQFAEGFVEFPVDDTIAMSNLIAQGSQVSLTLGLRGTSRTWAFGAIITDTEFIIQSTEGGPPIMCRANWVRSDTTDNAITSTGS